MSSEGAAPLSAWLRSAQVPEFLVRPLDFDGRKIGAIDDGTQGLDCRSPVDRMRVGEAEDLNSQDRFCSTWWALAEAIRGIGPHDYGSSR